MDRNMPASAVALEIEHHPGQWESPTAKPAVIELKRLSQWVSWVILAGLSLSYRMGDYPTGECLTAGCLMTDYPEGGYPTGGRLLVEGYPLSYGSTPTGGHWRALDTSGCNMASNDKRNYFQSSGMSHFLCGNEVTAQVSLHYSYTVPLTAQ